ncbi:alpha/beta hydrolase [Priestia megaterium]|nr:alpha/beta hydrolase [Priestia megaterium]
MPSVKIDLNNYLHYEEYGQGIPVIFIHPPGMGSKVFYYQQRLSTHMRVILPDLSGHGESKKVEQQVSISYYADEILRFMDALHLPKAVICGYSAGCLIAQHIGICQPNRIEALILSGSYPFVNDMFGQSLHNMGIYMVKEHVNILARVIARSHTKDKALRKKLFNHMKKADQEVWEKYYLDSLTYNCFDQLNCLTMPLLLMYGKRGDWTNHYVKYYKNNCKNAQFFLFKGHGHQLPTKEWEIFNELITGFVLTNAQLQSAETSSSPTDC